MVFKSIRLDLDPGRGEAPWVAVARSSYGMHCQLDPLNAASSSVRAWELGRSAITRLEVSGQSLSPLGEDQPGWPGEWLFVQTVASGRLLFEQDQRRESLAPGSLFVLDPARHYRQSFPGRTGLVALRLPKASLRERGLRYADDRLRLLDAGSADALALRELILCVARQGDAPSAALRQRLGEHLLDLVEILLSDIAAPRHGRLLVFRAQAHVRSHLADTRLSPAAIAAAVHVSVKHLQRLFKAEGLSLMGYVWQARLEQAQRLLHGQAPGLPPVQEIAWRCGFSSAAHFSRAYRRQFGLSPSESRAAARA